MLPTLLLHGLPVWLGALALAAVFSAEVGACEAILFMLSTSLSQDLYKRIVNPAATPDAGVEVARIAAFVGGSAGMLLGDLRGRRNHRCAVGVLFDHRRHAAGAGRRRLVRQARTTREALTAIVAGMIAFLADSVRNGSHGLVEPEFVGAGRLQPPAFFISRRHMRSSAVSFELTESTALAARIARCASCFVKTEFIVRDQQLLAGIDQVMQYDRLRDVSRHEQIARTPSVAAFRDPSAICRGPDSRRHDQLLEGGVVAIEVRR